MMNTSCLWVKEFQKACAALWAAALIVGTGPLIQAAPPSRADVCGAVASSAASAGDCAPPSPRCGPAHARDHLPAHLIGQQGRNGMQAGGGGGGGPHIGGGGGPQGAASAMPAPMPVAAIAIPPHNAVAPSNRRSLTERDPISISLRWRNNTDANQRTLHRPFAKLSVSYVAPRPCEPAAKSCLLLTD
jgi:hypothetical protein